MHKTTCKALLVVALSLPWVSGSFTAAKAQEEHVGEAEKLNPGAFIFDHTRMHMNGISYPSDTNTSAYLFRLSFTANPKG
jgi:hypothetical protein